MYKYDDRRGTRYITQTAAVGSLQACNHVSSVLSVLRDSSLVKYCAIFQLHVGEMHLTSRVFFFIKIPVMLNRKYR